MKISHAQTKTYKPITIELETEHEAYLLKQFTGKLTHNDLIQNKYIKEDADAFSALIETIFSGIDRLLKDNT